MAPIYPTAFSLSQDALERIREIHATITKVSKVARMSEADQIKLAETIYSDKLRLLESGMLDATPRTANVMAITCQNSTTSPLLRLPAEVRNKIFEYACSGFHIMMLFIHTLPYEKLNLKEKRRHFKNTIMYLGNRIGYPRIFGPPFSKRPGVPFPFFSALQQTCRQVYSETALLPFSANKYWFMSTIMVERFKSLLYDAQFECIRHVCFSIAILPQKYPWAVEMSQRRLLKLRGLRYFSQLKKLTICSFAKEQNGKRLLEYQRLLKDLETNMNDTLETVVPVGVKVVYGIHHKRSETFLWPSRYEWSLDD